MRALVIVLASIFSLAGCGGSSTAASSGGGGGSSTGSSTAASSGCAPGSAACGPLPADAAWFVTMTPGSAGMCLNAAEFMAEVGAISAMDKGVVVLDGTHAAGQ